MNLENYIPIDFFAWKGKFLLKWAHLGKHSLAAPMFHMTIEELLNKPSLPPVLTSFEQIESHLGNLTPTAFIFHVTRCGSTLLSQMLAAVERNLVLSEIGPLNSFLLSYPQDQKKEKAQAFQKLVYAFAQSFHEIEENFFIKLSSWNLLHQPIIQQAFPNTPWIFVYRDPIEVMSSLVQGPPGWLKERANSLQLDIEEASAFVLQEFQEVMLQARHSKILLLNYQDLLHSIFNKVPRFLNVEFSFHEKEEIKTASQFYSKSKTKGKEMFLPDAKQKQEKASERLLILDQQYTRKGYQHLENKRLEQ